MARNIDFDLSSDSFNDKFTALDQRLNQSFPSTDYLDSKAASEPKSFILSSKAPKWDDDDFEKRFQAKLSQAASEPEPYALSGKTSAEDDFEKRFQAKFEAAVSEPELSSKTPNSKSSEWDDDFEKRFQAKLSAASSEPEPFTLSSKAAEEDDFEKRFQTKLSAATSEPEPFTLSGKAAEEDDFEKRFQTKLEAAASEPEPFTLSGKAAEEDDFDKRYQAKLEAAASEPGSLAGDVFDEKKFQTIPDTPAVISARQYEPSAGKANETTTAKSQTVPQAAQTKPKMPPAAENKPSPVHQAFGPTSKTQPTMPPVTSAKPETSQRAQQQATPKVSKNGDLDRFMSAASSSQNKSSGYSNELPFATVRTQKLEQLKNLINENRKYLDSLENNNPALSSYSYNNEEDDSDSIELKSEWFDDDDDSDSIESNSDWLSAFAQTTDTPAATKRRQPGKIKPLADTTAVEAEISSAAALLAFVWIIAIPLAIILLVTGHFFLFIVCIVAAIVIHKKNKAKQQELYKSKIVRDVLISYFNATRYRHGIPISTGDKAILRNFGVAKNVWQNGIISDAFDGTYSQYPFSYYDVALNTPEGNQVFHGQLLEIRVPRCIQHPFAVQTRFTLPSRTEIEQMRAFGFITQTHADLLKKFSFHPSYDNDIDFMADKSRYVTLNDIDLPDLFGKLEQLSQLSNGLVYFRYWKNKMYFSIQRTYDPFELTNTTNEPNVGVVPISSVQQVAVNDAREISKILDTFTNIVIRG